MRKAKIVEHHNGTVQVPTHTILSIDTEIEQLYQVNRSMKHLQLATKFSLKIYMFSMVIAFDYM